MALKITPTMQNPLSLGNIYKHCPLYTLYITPLKINFLTSFPIVFFFLTFSSHPNPKRNQIRPFSTPGNFWKKKIHSFFEWKYLRVNEHGLKIVLGDRVVHVGIKVVNITEKKPHR